MGLIKDKFSENMNKVSEKAREMDTVDGIHCEVTNCSYHTPKCQCKAGKIHVGPTFASSSSETVCSTFKPQ